MSHIIKQGTCILDLDALGEAAANKGGELVRDQRSHRSYQTGACEHAIRLLNKTSAYEVGVVRHETVENAYDLAFDDWGEDGRALVRAFGEDLNSLKHEYGAVMGERFARSQGFMTQRVEDTPQRVELRILA